MRIGKIKCVHFYPFGSHMQGDALQGKHKNGRGLGKERRHLTLFTLSFLLFHFLLFLFYLFFFAKKPTHINNKIEIFPILARGRESDRRAWLILPKIHVLMLTCPIVFEFKCRRAA